MFLAKLIIYESRIGKALGVNVFDEITPLRLYLRSLKVGVTEPHSDNVRGKGSFNVLLSTSNTIPLAECNQFNSKIKTYFFKTIHILHFAVTMLSFHNQQFWRFEKNDF